MNSKESSAVSEQLALLVREILFAWDGRDVYFGNATDWPQRANATLAQIGQQIELRRQFSHNTESNK